MADHDSQAWDSRWSEVLRTHGEVLAQRPPNRHFLAAVTGLQPGRALDAGCGHGAEAMWLAGRGWEVTGVDFAASVLDHAAATAGRGGLEIEWVQGDLGAWAPEPDAYDLVSCLYVHVAGDPVELITRLAAGVRGGGVLLVVGHQPIDPATGRPTRAADQRQVSVHDAEAAFASLPGWDVTAREAARPEPGEGVDAVVTAVRQARD